MNINLDEFVYEYFPKDTPYEVTERLLGGMSNYTYVIKVNDLLYTIRKVGKNAHFFVNRDNELKDLQEAYLIGLVPETIYFNPTTGTKISRHIKGDILSEVAYEPFLPMIAEVLTKVHQHKVINGHDYNLLGRLKTYESYLEKLDDHYIKLKKNWQYLYESIYKKYPKVFTHGDAQRSNMVYDGKKLYLLDWEFSGLNDPLYDIASFGNISFNDSLELLSYYLKRKPNLEELNRVKFYRMFQALQWHLVAQYKEDIGLSEELKLDFKLFSEKYLQLAEKLYQEIQP
ncbi:MAG: phosphotransferase family protein [Candidatus Phytoplasma sp.]|nr:phosphotransferase family protein [Phytoplasma sp.]